MSEHNSFLQLSVPTAKAMARSGCNDLDIYLRTAKRQDPVLYASAGGLVRTRDFVRLEDHGVSTLYVSASALQGHKANLEKSLGELLLDEDLPPVARAEIAHHVGQIIAQDVIDAPESPGALARTVRFVDDIVQCVLTDPQAAQYITHMAAHHRSTASHMAIVAVLAVMVGAKAIGDDPERLREIGVAGMLHDVGKLAISPRVLDKPEKLTPDETNLIQQHPIESVRLLGGPARMAPGIRRMIIQHHERVDGLGYPLGLTGDQLDTGSKILAIVDAYHAISGPRAYRAPLTPEQANRVLSNLAGRQFDAGLLAVWLESCATRGIQPPDTWAVSGDAHHEDELFTKHEHRAHGAGRSEVRQRSERLPCDGRISATCVYAGRLEGLTGAPDRFDCPVYDLSRGGVCLRTPHPMYRGEVVHVLLSSQQQSVWVASVVAWCRQQRDGSGFRCGLRLSHRITDHCVGAKTDVHGLSDPSAAPI